MLPPPDQGAVLPHFLDAMVGHAVHDAFLIRHIEAEMAVRLLAVQQSETVVCP